MLSHAYIFRGKNTNQLYNEALFLAQLINCEQLTELQEPCQQCMHCKWIQNNSHPAVTTVSRLTALTDEDLSKSKSTKTQPTQIKTGQIDTLLHTLALSSPYNRVVIFTDAEVIKAHTKETENVIGDFPPPIEWREQQSDDTFTLKWLPLDSHILNASSANKMLKTLEEPSAKTLFIFLAAEEEQLLDTIVSRCQIVPFVMSQASSLLSTEQQQAGEAFLQQCTPNTNAYGLSQQFIKEWITEQEQSDFQALLQLQACINKPGIINNYGLKCFKQKVSLVQQAIKQLESKVNREQVFNQLFFNLCQLAS